MGVVFDDGQVVLLRQGADRVHLAADTGVVHRRDGLRPWGDERLDPGLIDVESVFPDLGEYRLGSPQHEGVDARDEGERRNDYRKW